MTERRNTLNQLLHNTRQLRLTQRTPTARNLYATAQAIHRRAPQAIATLQAATPDGYPTKASGNGNQGGGGGGGTTSTVETALLARQHTTPDLHTLRYAIHSTNAYTLEALHGSKSADKLALKHATIAYDIICKHTHLPRCHQCNQWATHGPRCYQHHTQHRTTTQQTRRTA